MGCCGSSNNFKSFQLKNVKTFQKSICQSLYQLRQSPKRYTEKLKKQQKLIEKIEKTGEVIHLYKNLSLLLQEGVTAWRSAISILEKTEPLENILLQKYLCKAAQEQAKQLSKQDERQFPAIKYSSEHFYNLISQYCSLPHPKCQCSQIIKVQTKPRFQSQKQFEEQVDQIAQNVILSLLVDDGIRQRKSRKILLDQKWKTFGIAVVQKPAIIITVMIFCTQKWLPKQKFQ